MLRINRSKYAGQEKQADVTLATPYIGQGSDTANNFAPGMLGKSPTNLTVRFLRYLKGEYREVLQVLVLVLEFDWDTSAHLIKRGFIRGYSVAHFAGLVGDSWSFVTPSGNHRGFHSFHRHMQDSLIAGMAMSVSGRSRSFRQFGSNKRYH